MKIFNIEKGKDVVYVQRTDLKRILAYENTIPQELIKREYKKLAQEGLNEDFIIFYEKETLIFFKNLRWIVDYREFCEKTNKEILDFVDNLFEKYYYNSNEIYNDLDPERKYNKDIIEELGQYYLNTILAIPKLKSEYKFDLIPLVPDGKGYHYENNNLCVTATLLPNWYMIYNKNGRNISSNKIPKEYLRALIAYFNGNKNINWTWDLLKKEYPYTPVITPDGKCILLKFYNPRPVKEKDSISRLARVWERNFDK